MPYDLPGVPIVGPWVVLVGGLKSERSLLVTHKNVLVVVLLVQLVVLCYRCKILHVNVFLHDLGIELRDTVVEVPQPVNLT